MATNDILEFLYGLQMFGIKLGLENSYELLRSVDNPQNSYGIVHVAGTNGKGSVCTFMREILTQSGYRVGTYTSPHLHEFNERITVNGQAIDDDDLTTLVKELRDKNTHCHATFFEFTTALALLYFARQNVDIVLLEVGMGGRLDATNVVQPLVSVITPVSRDHVSHLGDNLADIAAEKGGIIKSHTPVVIGPQVDQVLRVLCDIAVENHCATWLSGEDYRCDYVGECLSVTTPRNHWTGLRPRLVGAHQGDNAALALMALEVVAEQGFPVSDHAVEQGIGQAFWPGRLEWWPDADPAVLLDGAHNIAGAQVLAEYLASQQLHHIRWVGGFKIDKDVPAILKELLPLAQKFYAVAPPVEEPYPLESIQQQVNAVGVEVQNYRNIGLAFQAAQQDCLHGEIVVVAGSLFLVAACREYLISVGE